MNIVLISHDLHPAGLLSHGRQPAWECEEMRVEDERVYLGVFESNPWC